MNKLKNKIRELLLRKPDAVIAIDGMCASGKTTLASTLADEFSMQTIHMDDFFLPPAMRTPERLSQPGGNVHYERFTEEVASSLGKGTDFEYKAFSCAAGGYTAVRSICASKPIIIEGAYSTHPVIPDIYDLKIFLKISPETQLERIKKRNGAQALEAFQSKWIPFENKYFEAFSIVSKCDIIINNE
ncbi:MAG: uridine kinase [Clostridia bacterium]|nr:uridine kinase [Clostridia bacterium]